MLHDGTYMTDDEFLSNFCMDNLCVMQLNRLVENDEVFRSVSGKMVRRSSIVHIMVLLKYLGSYGNEASLQKISRMMGISKGAVNDYVTWACSSLALNPQQMCACILHNLLSEHPDPPDWFDSNVLELDQED